MSNTTIRTKPSLCFSCLIPLVIWAIKSKIKDKIFFNFFLSFVFFKCYRWNFTVYANFEKSTNYERLTFYLLNVNIKPARKPNLTNKVDHLSSILRPLHKIHVFSLRSFITKMLLILSTWRLGLLYINAQKRWIFR